MDRLISQVYQPLVTVLMPVYNCEKYLSTSIESILHQTFTDFEFIILDDGSTDDSINIIQSYCAQDQRIRLIRNDQNMGIAYSLNKGINIAKGKYIARMDADDISKPERLEKQVEFLETHNEVGILGCCAQVVDASGKLIEHYSVPENHSLIVWILPFGRAFAHPTVMMRTDLIQNIGGYSTDIIYGQDVDLWIRAVGKTQFANLMEELFIYRTHANSVTGTHRQKQLENVSTSRKKFISDTLQQPVENGKIELLFQSIKPFHDLNAIQISQVIQLKINIFNDMKGKGYFRDDEMDCVLDYISKDIQRIIETNGRKNKLSLYQKIQGKARSTFHKITVNSGILKSPENVNRVNQKDISINWANDKKVCISIIILSYNRKDGLENLLRSILYQNLKGMDIEIILFNNYPDIDLTKKISKKVLDPLEKKFDVKIIQSKFNWRDRIRYALASMAKFETILFLDDDVILDDRNFIQYMYDNFMKLRDIDIISCWCSLWTNWTDNSFSFVSLTFEMTDSVELTSCDICGPGICMFNRKIILNENVFDIVTARDFPDAGDMAFSIIANMVHGSVGYYLPSSGMLRFHDDYEKNSLHNTPDLYKKRNGLYKDLYKKGYIPVIKRSSISTVPNSPEMIAIQKLCIKEQIW